MTTRTLDLGCGQQPRNPFQMDEVMGIDLTANASGSIRTADLAIEPIPFPDNWFDAVTAFDFIEHVPRVIYAPGRRFPFVALMNEIYRVLKPGGLFLSHTPAFPHAVAFQDPTHVNIITEETFPRYFGENQHHRYATMYGFTGYFRLVKQQWDQGGTHLDTLMRKLILPPAANTAAEAADAPTAP
jgi:SAM-dependent methyltransferase